ncbi:MAG: hypothetical protein R2911_21885 [Caldilineaceae bacterium]
MYSSPGWDQSVAWGMSVVTAISIWLWAPRGHNSTATFKMVKSPANPGQSGFQFKRRLSLDRSDGDGDLDLWPRRLWARNNLHQRAFLPAHRSCALNQQVEARLLESVPWLGVMLTRTATGSLPCGLLATMLLKFSGIALYVTATGNLAGTTQTTHVTSAQIKLMPLAPCWTALCIAADFLRWLHPFDYTLYMTPAASWPMRGFYSLDGGGRWYQPGLARHIAKSGLAPGLNGHRHTYSLTGMPCAAAFLGKVTMWYFA